MPLTVRIEEPGSRRRPHSKAEQFLANENRLHLIDSEDSDGRTSDRSSSLNSGANTSEVFGPVVLARIEESYHGAGVRIDSRQVRPFTLIASNAGKCQVRRECLAAVLLRDDVVYFERDRDIGLRETAVLAHTTGAIPHGVSERWLHEILRRRRLHVLQRCPGLEVQNR
jgi:hypothetical protein